MRTRGQTLVLSVLAMLLIVLMGLFTASFAARARQRMQLQTTADAAAWSNAVATARTFNALAIMNRVQVAHTVSTVGTLSLISWSTLYLRHARNASSLWRKQAMILAGGPQDVGACRRGKVRTAISALVMRRFADSIEDDLEQDVRLYQSDTLVRWQAALELHEAQRAMVDTLGRTLGEGRLTQAIADDAFGRGGARAVSARGVDASELAGAVVENNERAGLEPHHAGHLVMASRGHRFLVDRRDTADWATQFSWRTFFAGLTLIDEARGRGYLSEDFVSRRELPTGRPGGVFADDLDGRTRTLLAPPFVNCPGAGPIAAAVGFIGEDADVRVGPEHHSLVHRNRIHAQRTFPPFVDYQNLSLSQPDDLLGQPKTYALVSAQPPPTQRPWELSFRWGSPGRAALDLRDASPARQLAAPLAVGTGVTYYGRLDHYDEPPNLFAPFWHAGLTHFAVDRGPATAASFDAQTTRMLSLAQGAPAADAYTALRRAGYRGFGP